MAQMTVAAAVGPEGTDHWEDHLRDTLAAGRGFATRASPALLCEDGVEVIREMDAWRVGWARTGRRCARCRRRAIDEARCVYVDFLSTGPAVSRPCAGWRSARRGIRRLGDALVVDLVVQDGAATGAIAVNLETGAPLLVAARATDHRDRRADPAVPPQQRQRQHGGRWFGLALRAGATLIDMEFVQFFPIGHLAPRLIGMDPIMWDPFRYKLGGQLLNGLGEEFVSRYGAEDSSRYVVTRDLATYAITKEVEAGRGSPAGGAWLSFRHVPEADLRAAFGPVIDKLAGQRHRPDAAGCRGGADRALPHGRHPRGHGDGDRRAAACMPPAKRWVARTAPTACRATRSPRRWPSAAPPAQRRRRAAGKAWRSMPRPRQPPSRLPPPRARRRNTAALFAALQAVMADQVGPFRTAAGLDSALAEIRALREEAGAVPPGAPGAHDLARLDWFDLRQGLLVAEAIILSAQARHESRGAHQREDFPGLDEAWTLNQTLRLLDGALQLGRQVPA